MVVAAVAAVVVVVVVMDHNEAVHGRKAFERRGNKIALAVDFLTLTA